ncbi:MAG: DNA recombination protein RmuC [Bacteroidales bacterium]|nr:DNA recombination protein RmuC [Bacteroidales bacterium]
MPDISTNDFNRLEDRLTQDNRTERQELTGNIDKIRQELGNNGDKLRTQLLDTAAQQRKEFNESAKSHREELSNSLRLFQESFSEILKERFDGLDMRQDRLLQSTEKKLDEMRATVDEKLQKTLSERLGQSFKLVSEQLESVQKGLGEMQNLANDVGGLKNALTNVKVRGNFGELQLKALLEQMLSPEQYDENVVTIPGSTERVEFAIKLPGKDENNSIIYLPIDSKFPKDVYDQYIEAIDQGDSGNIKVRSQLFESTVTKMAKDISSKYVATPYTTDFAILFVPVENIYAEVIRRTGLMQTLRDQYHIMVAGPTTLGALLSSLQMGFRTLAIEKRSGEVWKTLAAVKTEFATFGDLLDKVKKNIDQASKNIETLQGTRTRAINRTLRDVESLPMDQALGLLQKGADDTENDSSAE